MKILTMSTLIAATLLAVQIPAFAEDDSMAAIRAELARQRALIAEQQAKMDALADMLEKNASSPAGEGATHVGFYGEVHYNYLNRPELLMTGDVEPTRSNFHAHRAVILLSHAFADNLHFYSEVEFEGAPDSSGIETELEQLFIDWRLNRQVSLNIGQFLLPVGLMNETHEPNVFYGVERNPVEEKIIPATWWEKGVMVRTLPVEGLALDLAVHNGLHGDIATLGGADGLREFRQEFGGSRADSMGYTLRAKYQVVPGLEIGAAVQRQDDINNRLSSPEKAAATLWETHLNWQWRALTLKALATEWKIDGAMAKANGTDRMTGMYLEPSWKLNEKLGLFARYNQWNTAANQPGRDDEKQVNAGVNYWITPQVVLKADVQDTNRLDDAGDGFNLGVGLSF